MLLKDIEPFVRQATITKLTSQTEHDVSHSLRTPDCRLFFIQSGRGKISISGELYELIPGCAILFRSGTEYTWIAEDNEGFSMITVNFDYTSDFSHIKSSFHPTHSEIFNRDCILENVSFSDAVCLNRPIFIPDGAFLESRLRLLASEFYLGHAYATELLSSTLKSVIIHIVRYLEAEMGSVKKKSYSVILGIIEYLQTNYDKDITNEMIGEKFHFNPSYINRIFKQHTGSSLHEFLIRYRIDLARELLRTTKIPVAEIAASVGFPDTPHFIKSFRKISGKTPGRYRNSAE